MSSAIQGLRNNTQVISCSQKAKKTSLLQRIFAKCCCFCSSKTPPPRPQPPNPWTLTNLTTAEVERLSKPRLLNNFIIKNKDHVAKTVPATPLSCEYLENESENQSSTANRLDKSYAIIDHNNVSLESSNKSMGIFSVHTEDSLSFD